MFDGFEMRYVVTPEDAILAVRASAFSSSMATPESGPYLAEENPAATLAALEPFLAGADQARFASRTRCPAFRHRDKGP